MKENVKFSVELQNPEKINPLISRYKCFICTPDEPANGFIFSKDVLIEMSNTILGCAVVAGFMNGEDASLLGGHEGNFAPNEYNNMVRTPKPIGIGFADPYIEPWFEEYKGKEFLTTYVYLWTGKFQELDNISERNIFQSMEAAIDSEPQGNYKIVKEAMILALCMLENVTPAFKDSTFIKFSSEDYQQDIEELKREYSNMFSKTPKKYKDIDFNIPKNVKEQAEEGIKLRKQYGRGGTSVGLNTANYLINNTVATPEKVRRIAKYFPRHQNDNLDEIDPPSNGLIAWKLWGGNEGWKWSQKIVDDMNKKDNENKKNKQSFIQNNKNDNFGEEFKKDEIGSGDYSIKVNKSKEAMSDKPWGEVNKTALMKKVLKAKNVKSIVDDIYAQVEEGWEDTPSEHLKYPIMEINSDSEAVYNRYGLKSALGYAKAQNDTSLVSKINKIYKKLDLDKDNFAEFDLSEDDYKFIYTEEIKEKEDDEMSNKVNAKFGLTSNQMFDILNSALSQYKYKVGDYEYHKYYPIDYNEEYVYIRDCEEDKSLRAKYSLEGNVANIDIESIEEVMRGNYVAIKESNDNFSNNKKELKDKMTSMCDSVKYSKEEQELCKYSKPIDVDENYCYAYDNEMCKMMAIPYSMDNEEVKMSFENVKKVKMSYSWADVAEDDTEEEEDDIYMSMIEAKTGKKFTSDANTEALAASIRNELQSEYDKKLVDMESKMNQMTEEMSSVKAENEKLKSEDLKRKEQEKMAKVGYTLQEVIDTVPQEQIEKMRQEASNFSLENLNEWENKVYAEAYTFSKGIEKKANFSKIGLPYDDKTQLSSSIWDNIGK